MDVKGLEELRRIRTAAAKDFNAQQYNKEEYKRIIEDYLQSPKCKFLSDAQKERLREFFDRIEQNILKEVAEDKFKIPYQSYMEQINTLIFQGINFFNPEENSQAEAVNDKLISNLIIARYEKYFELDGKIDRKVGEMLYTLYTNPNVSLGVHGTKQSDEFDISVENNPYIKKGLGCLYPDLTQTVGFQHGRCFRHNHAELDFLEILTYHYPNIQEGQIDIDGVSKTQYSVLVAIPTEMSTCNYQLFDGGDFCYEERFDTEKPIEEKRRLKPQYIVGMLRNGDFSSFVENPKFSLEFLLQQNENERVNNIKSEKQLLERLGQETVSQQKNFSLKERVFNKIKQLFNQKDQKKAQMEEDKRGNCVWKILYMQMLFMKYLKF